AAAEKAAAATKDAADKAAAATKDAADKAAAATKDAAQQAADATKDAMKSAAPAPADTTKKYERPSEKKPASGPLFFAQQYAAAFESYIGAPILSATSRYFSMTSPRSRRKRSLSILSCVE